MYFFNSRIKNKNNHLINKLKDDLFSCEKNMEVKEKGLIRELSKVIKNSMEK